VNYEASATPDGHPSKWLSPSGTSARAFPVATSMPGARKKLKGEHQIRRDGKCPTRCSRG
jgi:hypothetical protein